jgi:hypothetical protein
MAEMVVFMTDREGIDIYHTAKLEQRGDVISVRDDGFDWGDMVVGFPAFSIVSVVDAVPADLRNLLSPEVPTEPLPNGESWISLNNTLQYRGFHLDPDVAIGRDILRAGARTVTTLAEVEAVTVQKPPIDNPAVIGDSQQVFG